MKTCSPITVFLLCFSCGAAAETPWKMHTIDDASRGADGVRLGDVDKDGRTDIVTGWEEGGQIRICFQPSLNDVRSPWPAIVVGRVRSPEDAVFADVNRDGWMDVVSCCEGKEQAVYLHLNPGATTAVREEREWVTKPLPMTKNVTRWMFCEPLLDGRLLFGSKEPNAQITLCQGINEKTQFRKLRTSGWLMSLRRQDCDGDGHDDVIYSDRKGANRRVGWLRNPGQRDGDWNDYLIGGQNLEVMFLDCSKRNGMTVACNTKGGPVLLMTANVDPKLPWRVRRITHNGKTGSGKGVAFSDVNNDGRLDLVCTCEHSERRIGAFWLEAPEGSEEVTVGDQRWQIHDISGSAKGIKFDRIEMLDIDQDGDQDLVTCEERDNLGVIWYENPLLPPSRGDLRD